MKLKEIGDISFASDDLGSIVTIKDYLKKLLCGIWNEEENFSGKRPFGNSGWQCEIQSVLIMKNIVKGEVDDLGYVNEVDSKEVDKLITKYIMECM
jgi:hypothetical protein